MRDVKRTKRWDVLCYSRDFDKVPLSLVPQGVNKISLDVHISMNKKWEFQNKGARLGL